MSSSRILVSTVGNATTRCYLFAKSGTRWRFVSAAAAPSTVWHPERDASVGLRDAIATLESLTGVKISEDGRLRGIDAHGVVMGAGGILRVGILAESPAMARRLEEFAKIVPSSVVSVVGERPTWSGLAQLSDVDLIVVGTGSSHPTAPLTFWLPILSRTMARARVAGQACPAVAVAGPKEVGTAIQRELPEESSLDVLDINWKDPAGTDLSPLGNYLLRLYEEDVLKRGRGVESITEMGSMSLIAFPKAVLIACRFLSEAYGRRLLYLDVGARDTLVVGSAPGKAWASTSVLLGTNLGSPGSLRRIGVEKLAQEMADADAVLDYLFNGAVRPWTIPISETFRRIQEKLTLDIAKQVWPHNLWPDTLVVAGGLRWLSRKEDVLELPAGQPNRPHPLLVEIVADEPVPLAAVGALSQLDAQAAVQILDSACGNFLGAYLCIQGAGKLTVEDREYELQESTRWRVPLMQSAKIRCETTAGIVETKVAGGKYGLLVDTLAPGQQPGEMP